MRQSCPDFRRNVAEDLVKVLIVDEKDECDLRKFLPDSEDGHRSRVRFAADRLRLEYDRVNPTTSDLAPCIVNIVNVSPMFHVRRIRELHIELFKVRTGTQ